jgi:hypothetical protein
MPAHLPQTATESVAGAVSESPEADIAATSSASPVTVVTLLTAPRVVAMPSNLASVSHAFPVTRGTEPILFPAVGHTVRAGLAGCGEQDKY